MYKYIVFILFLLYSCSNHHGLIDNINFYKVQYEELFLTQCFITFGLDKQISEFIPKISEDNFSADDYKNINRTIQSLLSTVNLKLIANSKESRNLRLYTDNNVNILDSILLKNISNKNIQCLNRISPRTKSYLVFWMKSRNLDESSKILCESAVNFICNNSQLITDDREKKVIEMISIFSSGSQFIDGFNECCEGKSFEICSSTYLNWFLEDIDGGKEYSIKSEIPLHQESKNRFEIVSHECLKIINSNDFQKMAKNYARKRIKEQKWKMKLAN